MKLKLHNCLQVKLGNRTHTFFNTMLKSVFGKLKNLESYFDNISFGIGINDNPSLNFKLDKFVKSYSLQLDNKQTSPNHEVYIKKFAIVSDSIFDGNYITEAGISSGSNDNPTIYNYFSLIDDEYPNGILKQSGEDIIISVCIYLEVSNETEGILTLGENKFVEFLLGEGTGGKEIFACRGRNLSDNSTITRETFSPTEKFDCSFEFVEDDSLTLTFSADLKTGVTYEIVFFIGTYPFARINVLNHNETTIENFTIQSRKNNIIVLGENIKSPTQIIKSSTGVAEENFYDSKYAVTFGDKISVPFESRFNNETTRFLSKDSKKIFFVENDKIYGYENINYLIQQIEIENVVLNNITKVVSFDDMLFVFTKSAPYMSVFIYNNGVYKHADINYGGNDLTSLISNIYDVDATVSNDGTVMVAVIDGATKYGYNLYFRFDYNLFVLIFETQMVCQREFNYVLAMLHNNFSDATTIFLKKGTTSLTYRISYFYPDKTLKDNYTTLAMQILQNVKEIYVKDRAIVVERSTTPSTTLYYYPELHKSSIEISSDEENNYVSNNLLYVIQKTPTNVYKIYSLVGYVTPTEFEGGFPKEINQRDILDFEFMNDTLLIFMDSQTKPVIAYNLFDNCVLIENISESETEYIVHAEKYNPIGQDEGVAATFAVKIDLWYFQKKFINLFLEKT